MKFLERLRTLLKMLPVQSKHYSKVQLIRPPSGLTVVLIVKPKYNMGPEKRWNCNSILN